MNEAVFSTRAPAQVRLSVAVGAGLVVQSALGLVWAGGAGERLAQLERRAVSDVTILERTVRVEEQISAVRASLSRIEAHLKDEGAGK